MAISFVVGIGALTGGLASLVTSSASRRATIEDARDEQYAMEGAVEFAAGRVRGLADPAIEPCVPKAGYDSSRFNGVDARVDCTNALTVIRSRGGSVVQQRDVVFEACVDRGARCGSATAPIMLRVRVNYEMSAGRVTKTSIQTWSVRP